MGHYSSFILRLWIEPGEGWQWGFIQHVATQDKRRFKSLSEMVDFISQHTGNEEISLPFVLDGDGTAPKNEQAAGDDGEEPGDLNDEKAEHTT